MLSPQLLKAIIDQHALKDSDSIHYLDHWARVLENGRRLTLLTGARLDVVELFAVFHDAGRRSDGRDPAHGVRGGQVARMMLGKWFEIDQPGMDLLISACDAHTAGRTEADVTIQTCWDSDRLDLGRAGIFPSPLKLCTSAGRDPDMIAWAHARSIQRYFPESVQLEWGIHSDH